MMRFVVFILCILLFLVACEKSNTDNQEPKGSLSQIPYIELRDYSPKTISEFDSVVFTIFYRDGDGDLGQESADSLSLWITDERFPLTQGFHIPPLTPVDTAISIQGVFDITLRNVILESSTESEEVVTFSIKMRDKAGNESNVVQSGEVTVQR